MAAPLSGKSERAEGDATFVGVRPSRSASSKGACGPCLIAAIRSLLAAGLTVRDVAELPRAHPRAIGALIG